MNVYCIHIMPNKVTNTSQSPSPKDQNMPLNYENYSSSIRWRKLQQIKSWCCYRATQQKKSTNCQQTHVKMLRTIKHGENVNPKQTKIAHLKFTQYVFMIHQFYKQGLNNCCCCYLIYNQHILLIESHPYIKGQIKKVLNNTGLLFSF